MLRLLRADDRNQRREGQILAHRLMRLQRKSVRRGIGSWGLHPRLSSSRAFGAPTEKPETRNEKPETPHGNIFVVCILRTLNLRSRVV
jgi:hypothetical protein